MKKTIMQIGSLVGLVMVLMVAAQAQIATKYRAHIPFDFSVGKLNLEAGDYVIELTNSSSSTQILTIRNVKSGQAKVVLVTPEANDERLDVSKLVFNRYENQYFLAEMITPTLGAEFARAKTEVKLAKTQRSKQETVALK
jgi:hypothetical protein